MGGKGEETEAQIRMRQEEVKLTRERENREYEREQRAHEREMAKIAQEREQAESEREERKPEADRARAELDKQRLELEIQLERVRLEGRERGVSTRTDHVKEPKLEKFVEGEDIDVYLRTFEMVMTSHEIPANLWAVRLAPKLAGKAREAFSRLDQEDAKDYEKVREAILKRYELTAESYRKRFRGNKRKPDESFREWAVRLTLYLERWLSSAKTE